MEDKFLHFEYLTLSLLAKFFGTSIEDIPRDIPNNFSKLKALKLLFFTCAVDSDKNDTLLKFFNRFYAMPYGPVESCIYEGISQDTGKYISVTDKSTVLKNSIIINFENLSNKKIIDSQIEILLNTNPNIITYSPIQLVNISHEWFSWKLYHQLAKNEGKFSKLIPSAEIIKDNKILHV